MAATGLLPPGSSRHGPQHQHQRLRCSCLLSFLRPRLRRSKASQEVLSAVQGANRGLSRDKQLKQEVLQLVDVLQQEGAGQETTAGPISATWRLLWTTEKETLFILKNAGLFRTAAGESYQVIDLPQGKLNNVIEFPPAGAFVVDSSLSVAGPQRLEFAFNGATLRTDRRTFTLPPFGKGWFDTVYLDDQLRVAKDSRGDTLIVQRDGPPRDFKLADG